MKIALVNNQYQLGGAETVMQQLHRGLRASGHDSRVHVAWGKTYPKGEFVTPFYPRLLSKLDHSRFHELVETLAPRAIWTDRAFRRLASSSAEVVHVHNFHGDYASIESLAYVAKRKPLVWTFHAFWGITGGCDHPRKCQSYQEGCGDCPNLGEWPLTDEDTTAEQLAAKLQHLASAPLTIVSPSQHLAEKVQASPVGCRWRVVQIPNGVNPALFSYERKRDPEFRQSLGLRPDATIILMVNRDFKDPNKGFAMMAEALAGIDPAGVQVVVAGQSSIYAVNRLPEDLAVFDAGYVDSREKMALLYEAADIFLFASAAENFPCVILEAMSSKCCVVATPTSGVAEQIQHRKNGFVAFRLSAASLGETLNEALTHPDVRVNCGENARRRVEEEFSEEIMVARHLHLYESLLKK